MNDEPEFLPSTKRPQNSIRTIDENFPVSIFSPFRERLRRKTVEERNRYLAAIRAYVDEKQRINHGIVEYEKSVVQLRNIDKIRKTETLKIETELEDQELEALQGLEVKKLKLLLERLELEDKVHEAQTRLDKKRNPPPPREAAADPRSQSIRDTIFGGGKYAREAETIAEELIRRRGGEGNLTAEDRESIRNARRQAAEYDLSKGQR